MAQSGYSPGNARFYGDYLFRGVDLSGKTMLDIGAGEGLYSFYAACMGASKVVSLEPEAAGSSTGMAEVFERTASLLEQKQVQFVPQPLQDYEPSDESFDVLFLHASINHLDEDACTRLHHDPEAQTVYLELFDKLAALAKPGAKLIAADCARRNLFADLKVTNPIGAYDRVAQASVARALGKPACSCGIRQPDDPLELLQHFAIVRAAPARQSDCGLLPHERVLPDHGEDPALVGFHAIVGDVCLVAADEAWEGFPSTIVRTTPSVRIAPEPRWTIGRRASPP